MSGGPIFIGGLAFSGKTPLRIALAAHPRIAMTRRTAMWERFNGSFGDLRRRENLDRCLDTMLADPAVAELRIDRDRLEEDLAGGPVDYPRLFGLMHSQHAHRLGKPRWGDQMGPLEHYADLVLTAFPDARMVHMLRDPRTRYAAAAGRHRQGPGKLGWETARWLRSVELARRNQLRYPDRYRVVRFETLVGEPEATLRDVAAFVGEDYDHAMAKALAAVCASADAAALATAAHRPSVAAFVERHAGAELAAFGYLDGDAATAPHRVSVLTRTANLAGLALGRAAAAVRPGPAPNAPVDEPAPARSRHARWRST